MKKSIKFLVAALLIVSCLGVFAACKKHKTHTYGTEWKYDAAQHWHECTGKNCAEKSDVANHTFTDTTGAKPWLVVPACTCGYKKTAETDYTKMTLAQFFDEILKNEGNYIVDRTDNQGIEYAAHWEVNGKNSYVFETYNDNPDIITDYYYKSIVSDDLGVEYYSQDNENWGVSLDHTFNLWLFWDGWIFKDELIKSADFNKDGNTYTFTSAKDSLDLSVITFNKTNIVMVNTWGTTIDTYTITFGNAPVIVLPQECQALWNAHPAMMFGIAPDEFDGDWVFYCADITAGDALVQKILGILGNLGYTIGEKNNSNAAWQGRENIGVYIWDNLTELIIEFNDGNDGVSTSYSYYATTPAA